MEIALSPNVCVNVGEAYPVTHFPLIFVQNLKDVNESNGLVFLREVTWDRIEML